MVTAYPNTASGNLQFVFVEFATHVTANLCVNSQWDIVNLMLPSAAVAARSMPGMRWINIPVIPVANILYLRKVSVFV